MKNLRTEIIIQSTREKVWKILTDFDTYGEWNPFITEISDLNTVRFLKEPLQG